MPISFEKKMTDIRHRAYLAWLTLFLGFCAMDVEAQAETELLRDVLSKPIKIERDEVVEIDGLSPPLSTSDQKCQTSRRLSEQRNLRSIKKIKVYRNGEFKVIVLAEELEVTEG